MFELLKKMAGISNFQIEEAFEKIGDEGLLENFVGVFPSNRMSRFINHAAMISESGKYLLVIANTDADNKPGVHWWSILDIEPKNDIFFFDSFGIEGLRHFIIQDDKKTRKNSARNRKNGQIRQKNKNNPLQNKIQYGCLQTAITRRN